MLKLRPVLADHHFNSKSFWCCGTAVALWGGMPYSHKGCPIKIQNLSPPAKFGIRLIDEHHYSDRGSGRQMSHFMEIISDKKLERSLLVKR